MVYPVTTNSRNLYTFPQHLIGSIEGEAVTTSTFEQRYNDNILSFGPQNLNLQALLTNNPYSGYATNSTYLNLNFEDQNGPGLKNFNVFTYATPSNYGITNIVNALDYFLEYVGYQSGYGFQYGGDCYYLNNTTTGVQDATLTSNEIIENICTYSGCPTCIPSGCYNGVTIGASYSYYDCCTGEEVTGTTAGLSICLDTTYDFSGVDITGLVPCSPNCSQQLTVGGSVTGTCENPEPVVFY